MAQCSAIGVSVAATPGVARFVFVRKLPCDTVKGGWQDGCDRVFFLGGGGGGWGM